MIIGKWNKSVILTYVGLVLCVIRNDLMYTLSGLY